MSRVRVINGVCLLFALAALSLVWIAADRPDSVYAQSKIVRASNQALPATTPAAPSCLTACNSLATNKVYVDMLLLSNKDSSAHTVTVTDCSSTPFLLFNGSTIPANTLWVIPLGGVEFTGCFKWAADDATHVFGTIVGKQ